jgi:beta-1,4-mannosyltransferase
VRRTAIIYPIQQSHKNYLNPYIHDLSMAFNSAGIEVLNSENQKHPLINLFFKSRKADYIVLNWLESVITYRFGILQFILSISFLCLAKVFGKKIIWIYHNKQIHNDTILPSWKVKSAAFFQRMGVRFAYKVVGFTDEVKNLIPSKYHGKLSTFNHPIKENRLQTKSNQDYTYDYLIWGEISPYKGVLDFLQYRQTSYELKNKKLIIVGSCKDLALKNQILSFSDANTIIQIRKITNEELMEMVSEVKFCLITHIKSSILSSATLMDSISFGFKVIGPNCGAFNDLSKHSRLDVRVYDDFSEILEISKQARIIELDYDSFIKENTWAEFTKILNTKILD